ncbi:hypothetical protein DFJ77DRAFT_263227 [Powellomyces hirtus]|nr:hypothetical protein DFJ77DRAFT_263227 [Powellomyces hirtus]
MTEEHLKGKLKDALGDLKKKERDLELAAEIGQQLVAVNNSLMAEYQELLHRQKSNSSLRSQKSGILPRVSSISSIKQVSRQRRRPSLQSLNPDAPAVVRADASAICSLSPTSPTSRSSLNRRSMNATEQHLNAQLETLEANLVDSERMHRHAINNLRRSNASLQDQLRATLQDLRDAEATHAQAVWVLERDLDQLREELQVTTQAATDLETDRRRLIREQMEVRRDSHEMERNDQEIIRELHLKIKRLESRNAKLLVGKREADRRSAMQTVELEQLANHVRGLEDQVEHANKLKSQCAQQQIEIQQLQEQLEEMRAREIELAEEELAFGDGEEVSSGDESIRSVDLGQEWDWTKWIERTTTRCWEIDVAGLKSEIANLQENRTQAYLRLQNNLASCRKQVVKNTPKHIASLATMIGTVVPGPVVGLATTVARGVQHGFEKRVIGFDSTDERRSLGPD